MVLIPVQTLSRLIIDGASSRESSRVELGQIAALLFVHVFSRFRAKLGHLYSYHFCFAKLQSA